MQASVVALPQNIDIQSAGPLFCGGITVFNPLVQFGVKPTDSVAVIGIGGLGHMALQFLNAWGCEVTAFTSSEAKKTEALKLGAHQTINSRNLDDITAAAGQFDLILSTVNVKLDWNAYIATNRYNVPPNLNTGGTYAGGEINHAQNSRSFPTKI
jgi:uncharacterized zinc-type alcohol dehydrogenase-like protein